MKMGRGVSVGKGQSLRNSARIGTREQALEVLLTPRQRDIFIVIDEFWAKFGCGPSIDDVMMVTGDKSRGNVARIMKRLCELGACKRINGRARSIRPVYINFRHIP